MEGVFEAPHVATRSTHSPIDDRETHILASALVKHPDSWTLDKLIRVLGLEGDCDGEEKKHLKDDFIFKFLCGVHMFDETEAEGLIAEVKMRWPDVELKRKNIIMLQKGRLTSGTSVAQCYLMMFLVSGSLEMERYTDEELDKTTLGFIVKIISNDMLKMVNGLAPIESFK